MSNPLAQRQRSSASLAIIVILGLLTVCCWGSFGALLGLMSINFGQGEEPPPSSYFPDVPGVSTSTGDNSGYCGSGGCFAMVLFARSADGAPRSVTVNRIVEELQNQGWRVEPERNEETRVSATGNGVSVAFYRAEGPNTETEDKRNRFDPSTEVRIVMRWANEEDHPTGAGTASYRPGTFLGNWLVVGGLLTVATGWVVVARSRTRRRVSPLESRASDPSDR
jgi:hypothetical protein